MTPRGSFASAAGPSFSVSGCTLISRVTGLLRLVVTGAVLGPTFFGNLFQSVNTLPNIFVELLVGALFTSLFVPPLVRRLDRSDKLGAAALANALLGQAMLVFSVLALAMIALGPLLLHAFASQVGNAGVRADQVRLGWPLLALVAPQVVLYGIAGVAVAAQNASGRFAIAAAAPAVENVGVIATMLAVAAIYGTAPDLSSIPTGEILLLGAGSTAAVMAHASVQWWGARRAGMTLVPRPRWADPEVREVARLALPSLGLTSLSILRLFAILIFAGAVAGGVVAVQLAVALVSLPIALGARPVATVVLPRLSRLAHEGEYAQFSDEAAASIGLGAFLVAPMAVAYCVLAVPLARVLGFGDLASARGQHLIILAITAMGLAAIGDATMVIASQTSYALRDAISPLTATVVRAIIGVGGMAVGAALVSGAAVLVVIGISLVVADACAAAVLWALLRRKLPRPSTGLTPAFSRALGCSLAMALPAWLVTSQLSRFGGGHAAALSALLAGAITGASVYLGAQRCLGSPELRLLREALQSARASRAGNEVLDPEGTLPNAAANRDIGTVAELEPAGEVRPIRVSRMSVPTLLLVGLLAGFAVIHGPLALAAAAAFALIAVAVSSPAVGAYVVLGVGPLVMGIDRGQVLPLLRPNEAVLLLVASGVCVRRLWERLEGSAAPVRVGARRRAVELSLLAMAGTASLIPLLWLKSRGQSVSQDDVLYAITLWKYLALYAVIRTAVRTHEEVRRCLGVILGSSAVVAVLAMLQSAGVAGIPGLLSRIFGSAQTDATSGGRGSSTLGSAIAVGDVCAFCAAITLAWLLVGNGRRRAAALTLLFVAGSVGSGQFSGVLALLVAVVAVALVLRQGRRVMQRVGPYLLVAAVVLLPVISQRLAGFSGGHLPSSWSNRLSNLETFFWPRLGKDFGWLLGVQPAARIPDPHRAAGFVWIESGYTWLLWSGGLPLLIAFLVFLATGLTALRNAVYLSVDPPTRVAAVAGYAALWVLAVLMFFDPHLSLRGAADLFFPLLALALVGSGSDALPAPEASLVTALVRRSPQAGLPLALKRGVDVVLSAFLLTVLAPVLLLVAVAVRLDSPGPAIYRGVRLGRGGIPFVALKFRTMRADADDQLHAQQLKDEVSGRLGPLDSYKVPADPRITRVGAVLRKLSIDEFPQLVNVLAGDMSLVGPRPEVPYALEDYRARDWRRFDVIPGMTGLWQVSGRSRLSQLEMLALDAEYADRWSLLLDARLLLSTPAALVRGDGAQ